MNIKKSNIITATLCTIALSFTSFYSGYAATNTTSGIQYNSQGKIVFDNNTEDTTDDVIFDAGDFILIDSMVADGKKDIKDELNKYEGIDISEDIPTFDTLAASIDAISEGTDAAAENILSGKKAIVGKSIVTGSMNDCSGRVISTDKIVENGANAEITISSGYYDEDSKISIPIETIIKEVPTINSNLGVNYDGKSFKYFLMAPGGGAHTLHWQTNPTVTTKLQTTAPSDGLLFVYFKVSYSGDKNINSIKINDIQKPFPAIVEDGNGGLEYSIVYDIKKNDVLDVALGIIGTKSGGQQMNLDIIFVGF